MKAPISGVVGIRQVDVGNIVNASTQTGIVSIAQIEPIAVIFTAPEDQLPDIKAALAAAPPKVIALSTDGKKVLSTGTLALINNQVDTTSGTIRLKARLRQQGPRAVAGPIGLDAPADQDTEGRSRRSRRRRPARQ